jgi:two-component system, NarL family, nitrate/nitrite response regulator NarL
VICSLHPPYKTLGERFDLNPAGGPMQPTPTSGAQTIRVLVADDTRIHTQLLADALRRDLQLEVISPPPQSRDLVAAVTAHRVNVVVLSSNLDEEPLRGFELLRELRASNPDLLAIMLLDSSKKESVLQAFRAGARGIFSRHDSVETLSKCIRSVYEGQIWANSQQMSYAVEALATSPVVRAIDANGLSLLSKREMDVVRSLAEGLTNREIAERLGLSQHTIKNYLFRVYDKLGVSSRLELLFMTLTQAGGKPSAGWDQSPSKFGSFSKGANSRNSNTPEAIEPHFGTTPQRGARDGKLEKLAEERGGSRSKATFIGTDPLD